VDCQALQGRRKNRVPRGSPENDPMSQWLEGRQWSLVKTILTTTFSRNPTGFGGFGLAPRRITRSVALYKVVKAAEQLMLFDRSFEEYMSQALNPDLVVSRYGRIWRLSAPRHQSGFIVGKLGFLHNTTAAKLGYDEKKHDFIPHDEPTEDVNFAHFVISEAKSLLAFEVRPPKIRPQSFVGAMQAMFRESGVPYRFTAVPEPRSFAAWRASVERVVDVSVTAVTPNPRTEQPKNLVDEMKSMGAVRTAIRATSGPDGGLNLEDPLLAQALGHVASGYGRERVKGIANGRTVVFDSQSHVQIVVIDGNADASSRQIVTQIITVTKRVKT
jgi:hypothetical protein